MSSPPHTYSTSPSPPRASLTPHGSPQYAPIMSSRLRRHVAAQSNPPAPHRGRTDGPASRWSPPQQSTHNPSMPFTGQHDSSAHRGSKSRIPSSPPSAGEADARTRLLNDYLSGPACGTKNCNHGTFSPHAFAEGVDSSNISIIEGIDDRNGDVDAASGVGNERRSLNWLQRSFSSRLGAGFRGRPSPDIINNLAKKHGFRNQTIMYASYYIPFFNWITQYRLRWLKGDFVAALTMASFYIPMALSYASNLGHIPPINGLYSFVFNPIIYAILGTCPQMVVGPEAAGSLLLGTVVKESVERKHSSEDNDWLNAEIAGVVTGVAGAVILIAGLTRLGFLDSVLSRPFLRGFISAIGFVIFVEQLIPELGLAKAAKLDVAHGSSVDKLVFIFGSIGEVHGLTTAVSVVSFAIIMVFREVKRRMQPRYPSVAYIPDRFLVVVLSAVLTWKLGWDQGGLEVLGDVNSSGSAIFRFHWPFAFTHMKHVRTAMSTSFLIALLGFFESSIAAKSLGEGTHELHGTSLSPNRELVALGVANFVGACFMALPAFGGYGRSKVNASTGGTTPMSSIFLSVITIFCVIFLLPYFRYLPKAVLSAMISVVAYSLIEECPHDIKFFWKIHGWTELSLMFIIFLATIFYSLSLGIALGIGLSILALIRHSTQPRIQILGKVPGTIDKFENAELDPERIEFIEGCLICKIPEPLTFANTGELKARLKRLEDYGTGHAHPALPRVRNQEHNRNIIFDVHGVTSVDGSGTQVLTEIVEAYVKRGVRVFFCRLPSRNSTTWSQFQLSGIMDLVGGEKYFLSTVDEALRVSEMESLTEYFDTRPDAY